ncbi:hypothetical protein N6L24_11720 [Cognatishimia sp. SS12]|uniref:hypothetical protein n=1 Tax=Cognatishimia sp. SS12 TaxID=2979465 RepID=UPI00232CE5F2|nr:hypothetical protein [Cognatishimia sp. SS12]MDC0738947.1 hypothetical protein [Cognatishimia sp. SS12]
MTDQKHCGFHEIQSPPHDHREIAQRHWQRGQCHRAVAAYDRAINEGAHLSAAHQMIHARALLAAGQARRCVQRLAGLLHSMGDDRATLELLAAALSRSGLTDEACSIWATLAQRFPKERGPQRAHARALMLAARRADAARLLKRALTRWPADTGMRALWDLCHVPVTLTPARNPHEALADFAAQNDMAQHPKIAAQIRQALEEDTPQAQKAPLYLAAAKVEADRGNQAEAQDYARLARALVAHERP